NTNVTLGLTNANTAATTASAAGTLNIFGGSFVATGSILNGGGSSTTAVSSASLYIGGTLGTPLTPINQVALTNSPLIFNLTGSTSAVANVPLDGGGNTIG